MSPTSTRLRSAGRRLLSLAALPQNFCTSGSRIWKRIPSKINEKLTVGGINDEQQSNAWGEPSMFRAFKALLSDQAGFTAIEYSLIVTLSLVTTAQLAQLFLLRGMGN